MIPDKQIKKKFRVIASKNPDKYYPTKVLKKLGFKRGKCKKCGKYYWSVHKRKVCGDSVCEGGYSFFERNPAKKKLDYIGVWNSFAKIFKKRGYTAIDRYPVAARWRKDTDFVQASIYDFQPYVVSGEVDPPANPLVVPQFCLRFNDIDNVGITGSHNTGFVMIGQHAFDSKEKWDMDKYFRDIHAWLEEGLGLPKKEIIYHEDAWAGGGNFGPCIEFFSRGLEIGNQVYIMYEQTSKGRKELQLKVLDMGMGHERSAWFTQGKATSYETTFPTVIAKLKKITKIKVDDKIMKKFLPYSSLLNVDEVDDVEKIWKFIAKKINVDINKLKDQVLTLAALYSVAEHSRSLLVALTDGVLPSNVGGGYNLRMLYRRAQNFIDKYNWQIKIPEVCEWHADYLKPLFPELSKNLKEVKKILDVEKRKYYETKQRNKQIISQLKNVDKNKLLELYDSHGINPEEVKKEFAKHNKTIKIPDNFYALVAERHEKKEQKTQTKKEVKLNLKNIPATDALYFDHYDLVGFKAKILKIIKNNIILDRTAFYPTSGGQVHDTGYLGKSKVINIFKQGNVIVHVVDKVTFKANQTIIGKIDFDRREQLAQHHTATHLLTGASKRILGKHVWQAGAAKTTDKSRLDITHYDNLTEEEIKKTEDMANKIVKENRPIIKSFMPRDQAEKRYGFSLYQGGAVPGKQLRIVEIEGFDVEACGGTHLNVTSEVGLIKILRTSKVQDGIIRIEFVAGNAAVKEGEKEKIILKEIAKLLECNIDQIPGRAKELFSKWKLARKKKLTIFNLESTERYKGEILLKTAEILRTQPEHVVNTIKRFLRDVK
jgi:alanyl-tRNA synthetase